MGQDKVIIFHIEGGEPSLIEKWSDEGKLPNFRKLLQRGVYRRLSTPGSLSSSAAYVSFTTGVNPAKHGVVLMHRHLQNGTYKVIRKYSSDIPKEAFWTILDRLGEKMLVLDMPYSAKTPNFQGTIVAGWGDEHPAHASYSVPKDLLNILNKKFGKHQLQNWYHHKLEKREEWKEFLDIILASGRQRQHVIEYLYTRSDWTCGAFNFPEVHWAGHLAWHLHDESHPEYNEEIASYCGDIILQSYESLDKILGNLMKNLPTASIFVCSALGMGKQVAGEMMLNEVLQRLELVPNSQKDKKSLFTNFKSRMLPGSKGVSYGIQSVEKIISPKAMMKFKKVIPSRIWDTWTRRFLDLGNNRAKSLAFQFPGDHSGLIRINLEGREPSGLVKKGEEYDSLCEFISSACLELKDTQTGEPVVKEVVKIRDHYQGEFADDLPDLAVIWREGNPIESVTSPKVGQIDLKEYHRRSGGHLFEGFFLGLGQNIVQNCQLQMVSSLDIVPTVFSILNQPIPGDLDGRVMDDIFK